MCLVQSVVTKNNGVFSRFQFTQPIGIPSFKTLRNVNSVSCTATHESGEQVVLWGSHCITVIGDCDCVSREYVYAMNVAAQETNSTG